MPRLNRILALKDIGFSLDEIAIILKKNLDSDSAQAHLWEELVEHIEKNGAKIVPPCMVIYHDTNYKEDSVDAEVIEPLIGDLPEK